MSPYKIHVLLYSTVISLLFSCSTGKTYLSPGPLTDGGNVLYIALTGVPEIAIVSKDKNELSGYIRIKGKPNSVLYNAGMLYVARGEREGYVDIISCDTRKTVKSIATGHTPVTMIKNAGKLYVANRFSSDVTAIDLNTSEKHRIQVLREPKAMALTPDHNFLLVVNSLPYIAATKKNITTEVSVIDTRCDSVIKNIRLSRGAQSAEDIAISPDGRYAYITHVVSRYGVPLTQIDRGWINSNGISIIDISKQTFLATVLIDDVDHGAANPRGIGANDKTIYVAVSGTHELMEIDRKRMHLRLDSVISGMTSGTGLKNVEEVNGSLSFLTGLKHRHQLSSYSPQYILLDDSSVYTSCRFTPNIEIFKNGKFKTLLLAEEKMNSPRRGELAFCDASICYQGWQSCSSCHPDGRADALNWDQLNDGIGNPKNTKSMLYSHVTPPSMSTGIRASAEIAVRRGILHTLGTVQSEELATDIDNYLKSLTPTESPYLVNGTFSKKALKGKEVFEKARCSFCHNGPYLTSGKKYDVGFKDEEGNEILMDTPTLKEIWRTAPYFHDGRALTVMEVLTDPDFKDKHGKTGNLSKEEMENLAEYILSL